MLRLLRVEYWYNRILKTSTRRITLKRRRKVVILFAQAAREVVSMWFAISVKGEILTKKSRAAKEGISLSDSFIIIWFSLYVRRKNIPTTKAYLENDHNIRHLIGSRRCSQALPTSVSQPKFIEFQNNVRFGVESAARERVIFITLVRRLRTKLYRRAAVIFFSKTLLLPPSAIADSALY